MAIKILAVDDEPDFALLIKLRFRKQIREKIYDFVFAANGKEALEQIEQCSDFDIMLCDLNMPVMDGITLLNVLSGRQLPMKSIVVSAYGDMNNIRAAMNAGAFDFVTKPIEIIDLEKTIDKGYGEVKKEKKAEETRQSWLRRKRKRTLSKRRQKNCENWTNSNPGFLPIFPMNSGLL
ncbi:MAG: response regulator [Bacteroidia bacterium]